MSIEKSMEQKLRRALAKEGYRLHKSRAQDWSCDNQQGYMIVDSCNWIAAGEHFDMSLDDVAAFVNA